MKKAPVKQAISFLRHQLYRAKSFLRAMPSRVMVPVPRTSMEVSGAEAVVVSPPEIEVLRCARSAGDCRQQASCLTDFPCRIRFV